MDGPDGSDFDWSAAAAQLLQPPVLYGIMGGYGHLGGPSQNEPPEPVVPNSRVDAGGTAGARAAAGVGRKGNNPVFFSDLNLKNSLKIGSKLGQIGY